MIIVIVVKMIPKPIHALYQYIYFLISMPRKYSFSILITTFETLHCIYTYSQMKLPPLIINNDREVEDKGMHVKGL